MFLPSAPNNSVTFAKLTDLLPEFQATLNEARTATGWDQARLTQIVAHDYGFLGPFITARIEEGVLFDAERAEYLVVEFTPPQGRDLHHAEDLFAKATRRAARGDVRGAVKDLKRVVTQFPEMAKYHQALGQAYLETGNPDGAEDELLRALTLDPRAEAALTLLANVYAHRNQPEMAIPLYRRAIALQPTAYALSNLASLLAKASQFEEAIATFEAALREDAAFPNAWYGLGLALYTQRDAAQFPRALDALDRALQVLGERRTNPPIWDASRDLVKVVAHAAAEAVVPTATAINTEVAAQEGERSGLPVRRDDADLPVLAKMELGWVHQRPYHRLVVKPGAGTTREHLVRHELEHLVLVNLARDARRNRWFVSNDATRQRVAAAIARDQQALERRLGASEETRSYLKHVVDGVLTQLYNGPIDLLIESRILSAHAEFQPLAYLSVRHQLEQGLQAAEDRQTRQYAPRAIFRANVAMNGALALWFEAQWPRRTDLSSCYAQTEVWPLAQNLYAAWTAARTQWTPGAEYTWIDQWAELLGLTGWYEWIEGNAAAPPVASPVSAERPTPTTNPIQQAEQMVYLQYLLGALEWLDREGLGRARDVAAEIAALGTGGIDLHGDRKYTLRTIPGKEFSGRHLVSYLYVCVKAVDPTVYPGIDLHEPYLQALDLHRGQKGGA